MSRINRLTEDVHYALTEMARELLKSGKEIPSCATRRDVEILATSRFCSKCGAIYSFSDYSQLRTGDIVCPFCKELEEAQESSNDLSDIEDSLENIKDEISNVESLLRSIKDKQ